MTDYERRKYYISQGKCPYCGRVRAADDNKFKLCQRCRDYRRIVRNSLAAAGLCKYCGRQMGEDKHKYCAECRKMFRAGYERKGTKE